MAQNERKGKLEIETTPEQDRGYDEAARGGPGMPKSDVGVPLDSSAIPADGVSAGGDGRGDEFDRAAREAANDVRRQDSSAD
jgi:hypothetical protein